MYIVQFCKNDFVFLARVRVSSSVFSSFGLYIIQLRNKEILDLAVVRVSSGYFPVLGSISYSTQEGLRVSG